MVFPSQAIKLVIYVLSWPSLRPVIRGSATCFISAEWKPSEVVKFFRPVVNQTV